LSEQSKFLSLSLSLSSPFFPPPKKNSPHLTSLLLFTYLLASASYTEPTPLPLPYLHLTTPLLQRQTQPTPLLTPSTLHALYLTSLSHHPSSSSSHNLLLTLDHIHTIPRSERDVHLTLSLEEGEREERNLTMGPNGLGFAGMFFVKPGDERILEGWGVGRMLKAVGVGREEEERRKV